MNRITVQKGYSLPFDDFEGYRKRRKRKSSGRRGGPKAQQNKMKACARKWKSSGTGKYRTFMKSCLRK